MTVLGVVYVTFFSDTFIGPFQGFLTTLGVPMAVWAGMFVADVIIRKKDYSTADLYDPKGRYGAWNGKSFAILVVGTVLGWGIGGQHCRQLAELAGGICCSLSVAKKVVGLPPILV